MQDYHDYQSVFILKRNYCYRRNGGNNDIITYINYKLTNVCNWSIPIEFKSFT